MTAPIKNRILTNRRLAQRTLRQIACLAVMAGFIFIDMGPAQAGPPKEAPTGDPPFTEAAEDQKGGRPEWNLPQAYPQDFDWVQLTSGEWLKGEIKVLYEDSLEFDSDELDLLNLDWEDVKEVRSHKRYSVRFEDAGKVTGMLRIANDTVFISNMGETQEFSRNQIIAIAPAAASGLDTWSAKVALSLNVQQGNTDQVNYTTSAWAKRRTASSSFLIDYIGIYNQTDGEDTAESQRANTYYDLFISRDYYWRTVFGEYFRDPFSNIDHRLSVGTGFGYHIINTSKTQWDLTPGLAYQYTRNVSVEAGESQEHDTPSLVVETVYDTELTRAIDFLASYKINIVNEASGTYTHHALAKFEFELTDNLDLDLSAIWDRIEDPTPTSDGNVPEQDDFYYFIGIAYEL